MFPENATAGPVEMDMSSLYITVPGKIFLGSCAEYTGICSLTMQDYAGFNLYRSEFEY